MMQIAGIEIEETFAEAFDMQACRLLITAATPQWARQAATAMTGFATSVIGCGVEAGIECRLDPDQTPDGRHGLSVLLFAMSRSVLAKQLVQRVGQCVLTCPSTAVFAGLEGPERYPLGSHLRYFGDGYQLSKKLGGQRFWRIPAMDGEFLCQADIGGQAGVGGGNLLLLARDQVGGLQAARAAAEAIGRIPGCIAPFPGGVVRSGSKVGSKYRQLRASINTAYCPTLRSIVPNQLPAECRVVLELVIDGLTAEAVAAGMLAGIEGICQLGSETGVLRVSAGNYGGKLGRHHFPLRTLLESRSLLESSPAATGQRTPQTDSPRPVPATPAFQIGPAEMPATRAAPRVVEQVTSSVWGGPPCALDKLAEMGQLWGPADALRLRLCRELEPGSSFEGVVPERLEGLTASQLRRFPLRVAGYRACLGDFFDIEPGSPQRLMVEGDCRRLDHVGAGMRSGQLWVDGSVGHSLAASLSGGQVWVRGDAGDAAASGMRDGLLTVLGRVGADLAGPLPGATRGMRGGLCLVRGGCGPRAAYRLRGGVLWLSGDIDGWGAADMLAGTVWLNRLPGPQWGCGLRRGSLVMAGVGGRAGAIDAFDWGGAFTPAQQVDLPFARMLVGWLQHRAAWLPIAPPAPGQLWRQVGDRRIDGLGEVLWLLDS
jgi:formylmethanofuran--tetrahydromethanopterin N-formyltransferase